MLSLLLYISVSVVPFSPVQGLGYGRSENIYKATVCTSVLVHGLELHSKTNKNKLRGLYSASELYRLSHRHLFAKLIANVYGWRGVPWSARRTPHGR
jgi:hypothetical protein